MKTPITAVFIFFIAYLQPTWAGEIKTWTDDEGVTHIEIEGGKSKSESNKLPSKYLLEKKKDRLEKCLELSKENLILLKLSQELSEESYENDIKIIMEKGQRRNPSSYLLRKEKSLERRQEDINFKIKIIDLKSQELGCPNR